ncbi:MAG: AmmeMemoRadiSam system protein B, partial [Acidobacteriota bacterium]
MRRTGCAVLGLMLLVGLGPCVACAAEVARVREPAVAGKFYPSDASELESAIRAFVSDALDPSGPPPLALVVPHAGYIYSGQIAADAYRQAIGHDYDVVVILGTNHTAPAFRGVSIYPSGGYRTPLGVAPIDEELAAKLRVADSRFRFRPEVHAREHSVEVQVPFVQTLLPGVKILPAVVGSPDLDLASRFGQALADALGERRALIVASSDLSHYPDYEDAAAIDAAVLKAVASLEPSTVQDTIERLMRHPPARLSTCACGQAPILAAMAAARALGAKGARIISYANSGDAAVGDPQRVVGYGAVAISKQAAGKGQLGWRPPKAPSEAKPLSDEDRGALLAFARESIRRMFTTRTTPLARKLGEAAWQKRGAFVTLKKHGELRGCIGHMIEDRPLSQVVGAMAIQAAFNDRRFP